MFDLDADLPAELVPLAWLIGVWEGTGVVEYATPDGRVEHEFGQRVAFTRTGARHLEYASSSWLLGPEGERGEELASELGFWRISRDLGAGDPGPAMLGRQGEPVYTTADSVETLRNAAGGFDLEVSLVHPGGVSELYLGQVKSARIDLATDAVLRSAGAKDYSAATRLYGLVEQHLLWAWDIAALGQELRSHASGRLAKVD
ncbi:FABP family protein [Homoserinibacter sp. YIM 151385]|uniref:FABP family protein n=1 Tax=Homoserinibacter sp. YIM 151385 TaxID=2985506 RepID=UPI0022F06DEF|nr:FABP family protein [Homoserinibacter sp. YIM 151385]WBU39310.1 FABP family protein [Homoserinibacter sp. YIM 151385]